MTKVTPEQNTSILWSTNFICLFISNFCLFMIFEMLLAMLPIFISKNGGSDFQVGFITGIFMIASIFIRIFSEILLKNLKKSLIICMLICTYTTYSYYFTIELVPTFIIRFLQGLGFGLATIVLATLTANILPKARLGEGIGYFGTGESLAISIGPVIGIWIIQNYDFKILFLFCTCILSATTLLTLFISPFNYICIKEKKTGIYSYFFEKNIFIPCCLILLLGASLGCILSFISLYFEEQGIPYVHWFLFTMAFVGGIIRLIIGHMFDTKVAPIILMLSIFLCIIGILLLAGSQSIEIYLIAAFFYGVGSGTIFPILQTWCIHSVQKQRYKLAIAMFFNFFDLGMGLGAIIFGAMVTFTTYKIIYLCSNSIFIIFFIIYLLWWKKSKRACT
ncbi:MFS transporter [Bacillus thuringiensis]|uniref:MFS transporter n=1 Tax=Bacillus thuringiensis TaxID=1428 RepID=UPI003D053AD3